MDKPAAHDSLLKIIKCNYTGMCNIKTCSCRKNAVKCTLACGQCKGIACANKPDTADDDVSVLLTVFTIDTLRM